MKYELRENQGIPAPLLALMAVATGLSVANCYYNQPLLSSMAKELAVSDFSAHSQDAARVVCPFAGKLCRVDEIIVAPAPQIPILANRVAKGGIGVWFLLRLMELPGLPDEAGAFLCWRRHDWSSRFVRTGRCIYGSLHQRLRPKVWCKVLLCCRRMRIVGCLAAGILGE